MLIELTYDTYKSFVPREGKAWMSFYVVSGGQVTKAHVVYFPSVIFTFTPNIGMAQFKGDYKEAIEVISMASGGSGVSVTTPTPNSTTFVAKTITITPASTAMQLPVLPIPDGRAVIIRSDPKNGGASIIFIADSAANVALATSRYSLAPGDFVTLKITDLSEVWVFSTTNNVKVDVTVEQ